jgi:hypothetical protein
MENERKKKTKLQNILPVQQQDQLRWTVACTRALYAEMLCEALKNSFCVISHVNWLAKLAKMNYGKLFKGICTVGNLTTFIRSALFISITAS